MQSMTTAFCLLLATAAAGQTVGVHGFIDVDYAWNRNHPRPQLNFFSGAGTTAHRADELALNVAALEIVHDPKPVGFHLILGAGDSLDVVHAAEPHPHRHPLRNLYQASVSYNAKVGRGLLLEAGVYPSHIGFEGFFTKDNWNYTRGWLAEFSPYYQAGIKASYAWSDRWSGQVHVLRGWQNIGAHVPAAIGTQIAYTATRFSTSLNTYGDPHRKFGDFIATYKVTPRVNAGISIDRGHDHPANWLGVGTWARYAFNDKHAIAVRAERFRDPDAGISGFAQIVSEATLTYEHRPTAHLILKFEGRRDHSTASVFNGSRNQTLAIASAVEVF